MGDLTTDDFAPWFHELWGVDPFPWQQDLVVQVYAERRWPDVIDLPTGTGKTSLVDIAVFLQALDASDALDQQGELDAERLWMPRRIVTVVDRRIVVDQTSDRATAMATALTDAAGDTVMYRVAQHLRSLAGTGHDGDDADAPLLTATLRGAIAKDESWLRRPDVPAILSSTIDQVGSRLLFRGYGISRAMRPIHAGLLGNDVLWLLDEVHLARPFADTLAQVGRLRRRGDGPDLPDRWHVVEMSATPDADQGTVFPPVPLAADSHPLIGRRLRASKPVELAEVKVPGDGPKADERFAAECAARARALVTGRARTVGVIVNRVDTARLVHQSLRQAGVASHLLTGRMRPVDRDRFLSRHRSRLETGRTRLTDDAPFVLVSTQCVEVGADLDLDAIVTEVASLDALVQRFGRVDRAGDVTFAGEPHTSVILARSSSVKAEATDPVYRETLPAVWAWLTGLDVVDFGIRRLDAPTGNDRASLVVAAGRAPVLLPTQLDQLSQTSIDVSGEPDVARWLHGDADAAPDVHVVWRADIDDDLIRRAADEDPVAVGALAERLSACPPASTEAMAVPVGAARRWLDGLETPVVDVDGLDVSDGADARTARRPWVTWRQGTARARRVDGDQPVRVDHRLRPGDVLVVPATHGGITDGTWDPTSTTPVTDHAATALHDEQRVDVIRFHPALVDLQAEPWPTARELDVATRRERQDRVDDLLSALVPGEETPATVRDALRRAPRSRRTIVWPAGRRWSDVTGRVDASVIVWAPAARPKTGSILGGAPVDTDATDEASSFSGAATPLDRHEQQVGRWARVVGQRLGITGPLLDDLQRAGRIHDEGKRDPRFQVILHHGDELAAAAAAEHPLAKSIGRQPSADRRQQIRTRSGYPRHARHELTSLALCPDHIDEADDPDLVAHLVASHHGWCRPFAPPLLDEHPVSITGAEGGVLDSGHGLHGIDAAPPERFWALTERMGWYGLAWLEAVLRLSDHRQSEIEQNRELEEAGGPR